jgi:hypothetical protein
MADKVYLKNGDVISGDIKAIWDDELIVEPEYSDEFSVEMEYVDYIEGKKIFTIEFNDGHKIQAEMLGKAEDGKQLILVNGRQQSILLSDLAELEEPEEYFDWEYNLGFNIDFNKGNTNSESYVLKSDGLVKLGDHRHIANVSFEREDTEEIKTKNKDRANYSYNWSFNDPWFLGLNIGYERDPIKELTYRYTLTPGVGYEIWDDSWRFFTIQIGSGFQEDKVAGEINHSQTAVWLVRFNHDVNGGDVNFFHNHSLFESLSDRTNTVFNSTTGIKSELTSDLDMNISLDYDKESNPSDGASKEDLRLLIGVSLSLE